MLSLTDRIRKRILTSDILGEGVYWIRLENIFGDVLGEQKSVSLKLEESTMRLVSYEDFHWELSSGHDLRFVIGRGADVYIYSDWYANTSVVDICGVSISVS